MGRMCTKPVVVAMQGRYFTWRVALSVAADIGITAEDTVIRSDAREGVVSSVDQRAAVFTGR